MEQCVIFCGKSATILQCMSCDVRGLASSADLMGVPLSASHWNLIARDNRVKDGGLWAKREEKTTVL